MAKKSMVERQTKRVRLVAKYNPRRASLKKSIKLASDFDSKQSLYLQLERLPLNSSSIRLRNRCWVTGRSRGFYRTFGLSRHVLREMYHNCLIPGLRKSSW
jgi:small subunit ribosomal protein S14